MFLTLEDPRAKIQGSRDPLGVLSLWLPLSREVVTNLTTVTTSIRGFTILMLGRYVARKMIDSGKAKNTEALSIFLRMEQMGAYARHIGHEVGGDIRGIERVRKFLNEEGRKVPIGDNVEAFILSDQKTYGLWGLFTVSARVSGICADGPVGLTPFARDFVERVYWPHVKKVEGKFLSLASRGGRLDTSSRNPLFNALVSILPERLSSNEVSFYGEVLRDADHAILEDNSRARAQRNLARLLRSHADLNSPTNREEVLRLAAQARDEDKGLADSLEKILRLEALLAPSEALFDYLLTRNKQTLSTIARHLTDRWGRNVPHLDRPGFEAIFPQVHTRVGEKMARIRRLCDAALAKGDDEKASRARLQWNELVWKGGTAAPWLRVAAGKLDVRYRIQERELPSGEDLPDLWRNSYIINALKSIIRQIEGESP